MLSALACSLLLGGCYQGDPQCIAAEHHEEHVYGILGLVIGLVIAVWWLAHSVGDRTRWKPAFTGFEVLGMGVLGLIAVAPLVVTGGALGDAVAQAHSTNCGGEVGTNQSLAGFDVAFVLLFMLPISVGAGLIAHRFLRRITTGAGAGIPAARPNWLIGVVGAVIGFLVFGILGAAIAVLASVWLIRRLTARAEARGMPEPDAGQVRAESEPSAAATLPPPAERPPDAETARRTAPIGWIVVITTVFVAIAVAALDRSGARTAPSPPAAAASSPPRCRSVRLRALPVRAHHGRLTLEGRVSFAGRPVRRQRVVFVSADASQRLGSARTGRDGVARLTLRGGLAGLPMTRSIFPKPLRRYDFDYRGASRTGWCMVAARSSIARVSG